MQVKFILMVFTAWFHLLVSAAYAQSDVQKLDDAKVRTVVKTAIDGYIRPSFDLFANQAAQTRYRLSDLCSAPSADALQEVRDEFVSRVVHWSQIEILRFGPLVQDNRFERIHFWPDRRGRALRQVQSALATKNDSVISVERLKEKSVAVQGLGALEYLLHGTGSEELSKVGIADHRCKFAEAVAGNLTQLGEELRGDWSSENGYAKTMVEFGPANPNYRTAQEVTVRLFGIVVNGLDWVKDVKLKPPLGKQVDKAKPKRAIFWRSNLSAVSINANLDGMDRFLKTSGLFGLLPTNKAWLDNSIDFEFKNADRTLKSLKANTLANYTNEEPRSKLNYMVIVTDSLRDMMVGEVGPALGVQSGFSVLDGD